MTGRSKTVLPACRCTDTPTVSYAHDPGSGSPASADWTSSPTATTTACHGMSGFPVRAAAAITAGPYDGRSLLRGVAQAGGTVEELEDSTSRTAVMRTPLRSRGDLSPNR